MIWGARRRDARRNAQPASAPAASAAPVYFLHIPKTAGVTVTMFLDAGFRYEQICPATDWDDMLALPVDTLSTFELFRGHFGAMLPGILPRPPRVVTTLRDPVERALSEWRYVLRHADHPYYVEAHRQGPSLTTWVHERPPSPQARSLGAGHLDAGLVAELRRNPLPDRYGAQELIDAEACRQQDEMSEAELLDRAMAFLTDCTAVGFADRLDDFAALVASRLGWAPPQPLGLRNSAPAGEARYPLSDGEREAVLERDAVDVQLVERARREFGDVWDADDSVQARKAWSAGLASGGRRLQGELVLDLLDPIPGRGWLPVMNGYAGRVRWLGGGLEATVDLPVILDEGTRIEACCASALDQALYDAWSLEVNGEPIALERHPVPDGVLCSGVVSARTSARDQYTRLLFRVPYTVRHQLQGPMTDDALDLGVAFRWLRLESTPA